MANVSMCKDDECPSDIVDRIRNRLNDAPMPTERLLDEAADRIAELETLLRRIDAVITWETTPLGRSFQDEIEAALKRQ